MAARCPTATPASTKCRRRPARRQAAADCEPARDDSDSDEEQPAVKLRVTACRTQRTQVSEPPARIRPAGGKCEHGRVRNRCKECGGAGVCEHGRERRKCKECGGADLCEHGRQRNRCKECGGAGLCEHGRERRTCKKCGGAGLCEHGRQRSRCKECGGAGLCEHGRVHSRCKECGGAGLCEHGRERSKCKECKACAVRAMDEGGLIDFLDVLADFDVEIDV